MVIRNYAIQTDGLFARIIGKISALTLSHHHFYRALAEYIRRHGEMVTLPPTGDQPQA